MSYTEALLRERAGYEAAGKADRVAQVDAELERVRSLATDEVADEPAPADDKDGTDDPDAYDDQPQGPRKRRRRATAEKAVAAEAEQAIEF